MGVLLGAVVTWLHTFAKIRRSVHMKMVNFNALKYDLMNPIKKKLKALKYRWLKLVKVWFHPGLPVDIWAKMIKYQIHDFQEEIKGECVFGRNLSGNCQPWVEWCLMPLEKCQPQHRVNISKPIRAAESFGQKNKAGAVPVLFTLHFPSLSLHFNHLITILPHSPPHFLLRWGG